MGKNLARSKTRFDARPVFTKSSTRAIYSVGGGRYTKHEKSAYDQVTDDEMRGGDEGVGSTKYNDCLNWERRM